MTARGVFYVHSAPPALSPHIEWAAAGVLGVPVSLEWADQPAAPGTLRAELHWEGRPGTAAGITSALRNWKLVRFEATEDPTPGTDGVRFSFTPSLGVFTGVIGANGDIMVPEDRLRAVMANAAVGKTSLENELDRLLGTPWDNELEPFRRAGDGAPVRWLHAAV
ncbi:DUF3145 domain-containing protein [Actinomadura madurae]|uniref:DUF3145 domain-containing protein n=1 Tax=Actinomadura madurae TaxID=1993 RepID=UPI00202640F8|nr:DUF3145 domain-containing protein [Actinomadura madurae]MCP9949396.1 DUF3145 domain-containing protein [Actinomadura madurae]MCP9966150.1 DUF3145 domain-containing protein [Actinomadura madurae]MCP9978641.1 DUF3145 domain-containing protein [Actinomadura madurae]MCQ0009839.1 DUF3145 domain-containing protein [Actinomadura madurae]MCQ0014837.1 DUF3145 domain-containing protein [Actinomadura madurae]